VLGQEDDIDDGNVQACAVNSSNERTDILQSGSIYF
jgi:hypothetical protein